MLSIQNCLVTLSIPLRIFHWWTWPCLLLTLGPWCFPFGHPPLMVSQSMNVSFLPCRPCVYHVYPCLCCDHSCRGDHGHDHAWKSKISNEWFILPTDWVRHAAGVTVVIYLLDATNTTRNCNTTLGSGNSQLLKTMLCKTNGYTPKIDLVPTHDD